MLGASTCGLISVERTVTIPVAAIPAGYLPQGDPMPLPAGLIPGGVERPSAVVVERADLELSGGEPNWDFVSAIKVQIEAPGLPAADLLELVNTPQGVQEIQLDGTGLEALPYLLTGAATAYVTVYGTPPTQTTYFSGTITVRAWL